MKLGLKIAAGYSLACALLSAAPPSCITGTLASYIALGAEGCTFNGNVFANFAYSASASGGATMIRADQITVVPLLILPETARFSFSAPWSVGKGQKQDSIISYTAVLPCGNTQRAQLDLTLGAPHIGSMIGSVTVDETTDVGDLHVFDRCVELCQPPKANDSLQFSPVSVLLISDHVSLSGGLGGASLSEFASALNRCILCV
jgi:hypothetical protein